jgi:[ribosomal protein S5]-alanine N-acetyltransferase
MSDGRRPGRVTISGPRQEDRDAFLAAVDDSTDLHAPWVAPPRGDTGFVAFLARAAADDHVCRLVRRREDGALVGVCNLWAIQRGVLLSGTLGYYGFRAGAGSGYVREGVALLLDEAFDRHGLHRVEANVQPGNAASLALVRALGFRHEGFSPRYMHVAGDWRDHERFAVLADEWPTPGW